MNPFGWHWISVIHPSAVYSQVSITMADMAAIHRDGLAAEITAFGRSMHGRNLCDVQVSAECIFAKWQIRLAALAPEQWKVIVELREEMPGLSAGMPQFEAYGNFLERELAAIVRVLKGLPAVNARFDAYQALAARDARAYRDLLQPQPQLSQRRDRDSDFDRRRDDRARGGRTERERSPERRRERPQPRREDPPKQSRGDDSDGVAVIALVRALYADRPELSGRCLVCEYVGSTPPGTTFHSTASCPQRGAAFKKMKQQR